MRRALLVLHLSTHFRELRRVASLLASSGRWTPVLHFARAYAHVGRDLAWAREQAWECTGAVQDPGSVSDEPTSPRRDALLRLAGALTPDVLKALPRRVVRRRLAHRRFRREREHMRRVLAATRPDLLVLPEDSLDYLSVLAIEAARERGARTVIVPFTIPNPLEHAEALFHLPSRWVGPGSRGFARTHPRWVFEHRGRKLLRWPVGDALAAEAEGIAPPNPWVPNSGRADAVALESEAMAALYRRLGFEDDRLAVTGALGEDELARQARDPELRVRLLRELGMSEAGHVFLCALPPDQHHNRPDGTCEFPDHAAVVRFWIETLLSVPGAQVIANPHPRTDPATVTFLESLAAPDGRRARLVPRDITSLIPACDTYIAPASATIRYALACGKATIDYDVYRFRYGDYRDSPALRAEDGAEFTSLVRRLGTDPAFHAEVTANTRAAASRWGRLDGKAGERMLALFDRLVSG